MIRTRTTRADTCTVTTDDLQILQRNEQPGCIRVVYTNQAGVTRTRTITFR